MSTTKSITTASNTVAVLIILGIVIAANVIVSQFRGMRGDLTEEKLYTLSDGTKDLMKDLERDVTLKFFYSKTAEGLPINSNSTPSESSTCLKNMRRTVANAWWLN